jgi:hypothetical protein
MKRWGKQKTVLFIAAIGGNLIPSGFGPQYPKDILKDPRDAGTFQGQILSPFERVDLVERAKPNVDLVWRYHKRVLSMPDEMIRIPQNNSDTPFGKILTVLPGGTEKGYDFYPSPDHRLRKRVSVKLWAFLSEKSRML